MFDLEKLKSIDLQNIDFSKIDINKIVETALVKKDLFASILIGVVSLVIAIVLVKDFFTQTTALNADITTLKNKIEVISTFNTSKKRLKIFLKSVPVVIDEDLFSSTITDIAASNNVTVVSFVPGEKQEEDLYTSISAGFDIEAPDYPALLSFLKALENAPFSLRVDNCVILKTSSEDSMQVRAPSNDSPKDPDTIKVHFDLTTVEIKR